MLLFQVKYRDGERLASRYLLAESEDALRSLVKSVMVVSVRCYGETK